MAADNLPLRDEKGHGTLPETFAKVRILPKMYVKPSKKKSKQTTENRIHKHTYFAILVHAYTFIYAKHDCFTSR